MELEQTLQSIDNIAETQLVSGCEEVDLIEPQAAKQVIQCGMFPYDDGSLWHICK